MWRYKEKKLEIIEKAKASAHGINVIEGRPNPAKGDCAFEAPIFNVNDRLCFDEKLTESIDYYRKLWVSIGETLLYNTPFNPGYSHSDWKAGFNKIKKGQVYEVDFFGDMIIPSIACGIKKIFLIFNTNTKHPRDPITVVDPVQFGVEPTSKVPVVLAYDLVHYESIHPVSSADDMKCIELVNKVKSGKYTFTFKDLPSLVDLVNVPEIYHRQEQDELSILNREKVSCKVVSKKIFEMTPEEKRRYHRERYKARKNNLDEKKLSMLKNTWRKNKAALRDKQKAQDEIQYKAKESAQKSKERLRKRTNDEETFKAEETAKKNKERSKKRTADEKTFKLTRTNEKSKERQKKREEDEAEFKAKETARKSKERLRKRSNDEETFKAEETAKKKQRKVQKKDC